MTICPTCNTENLENSRYCSNCGCSFGEAGTGRLNPDTILAERYIIVKTIGQGGMGAVYMALDSRLSHMTVAVKEMSIRALGDDSSASIGIFQKEAAMLISLKHPALPVIRDFFSGEQGRWYLVMDYIEGETLSAVARRRGSIPEAEVLEWGKQLCDILDYLHNQNPPVIFRDLKPSNIMLTPGGEIKLIDFGIARHFQQDKTSDTAAFGSSGFAPPEQYGINQTDHRSDIYSLGATLHYLLTGIDPSRHPFSFDPPSQYAQVSPRMETTIMKSLEIKAENRPQDIQAVLTLLPQGRIKSHSPFHTNAFSSDPSSLTTQSTTDQTGRLHQHALGVTEELSRTTPLQLNNNLSAAENPTSPLTEPLTITDTASEVQKVASNDTEPGISYPSAGSVRQTRSKQSWVIAAIAIILLIAGGSFVWLKTQDRNNEIPAVGEGVNSGQHDDPDLNGGVSPPGTEASSTSDDIKDEGYDTDKLIDNNQSSLAGLEAKSGVTIKKYDQYAGNQHMRGIEVYIEPSQLPAAWQNKARYIKCDMRPGLSQVTLENLQQLVDSNSGSRIEAIKSGFNTKMISNSLPFDQPHGLVIFLDEQYKVVGYYQGIGQ